jgi:hypothetical protein
MKFFTYGWWTGDEPDTGNAAGYREHLDRIRAALPPGARELAGTARLHDARLLGFDRDEDSKIFRLALEVYDSFDDPRRLEIEYWGVTGIALTGSLENVGALGYDELDIVAGGAEHRMLFSRGTEIVVIFADLAFRFVDSPPSE